MYKSELITIRDGIKEDENFIYASWLRGMYYGDTYFCNLIPKSIFMQHYHDFINKVLQTSIVKIACLKEDSSAILGYVVLNKDKNALHYAFVKKPWRKIGIFKDLLDDNIHTTTQLTDVGRSMLKNHSKWIFNPFII